jgi:hypothetical protein
LYALRQCVSGDVHCIDLTVTLGGMFENKEELERALSFILCVYLMTLSVIPNTLRPLLAGLVNNYLGRI